MAITTTQIDNLPDYSPANLLKALNYAIVQVTLGNQGVSVNGRSYTRANLTDLKKIRDDIKAEVDAAASSSGRNSALADFSDQ